jgi:hypothetical protein
LGGNLSSENELAPTPRGLANRVEPTANPHNLRTDFADAYSKPLKKIRALNECIIISK